MRYTRLKSNASARARPARPTSSAARSRWRRRSRAPKAASSCSTALHGNPFDGHTLDAAITDIEKNTGIEIKRAHVDKGYRGHNHPNKFRIWITGQVRRTTVAIKREMKRRAAVEPIIGHLPGRAPDGPQLPSRGRTDDRINAVRSDLP